MFADRRCAFRGSVLYFRFCSWLGVMKSETFAISKSTTFLPVGMATFGDGELCECVGHLFGDGFVGVVAQVVLFEGAVVLPPS